MKTLHQLKIFNNFKLHTYLLLIVSSIFSTNHVSAQCSNSTCNGINTFTGLGAGSSITGSGNLNSFFGTGAGGSTISGDSNCFFGDVAGFKNTTGNFNSFIGKSAGYNLQTGNSNICIGSNSGPLSGVNPSNRLYLDVTETNDPLIYGEFDNDVLRVNGEMQVTDKMGIGTNNPTSTLHIDGPNNINPIRVALSGQTKFHVSTTGGVSIGTPNAPPGNGLAVSGNTGIGTTTPAQKLDVIGAIKIGNTTTGSNGSIRYNGSNFQGYSGGNWVNLTGSSLWSQNGSEAFYNSGNVGVGTNNPTHLLHVAGDLAVAGSVVAPSDKRLKQDITTISDALSIVSQLTPKTYKYKTEKVKAHGLPTELQYGFIAQDVEKILPSIVHDKVIHSKDGTSYKGITYDQLIPILTQAVKELHQNNLELKTENKELQKRNNIQDKTLSDILVRLDVIETLKQD